MRDAIDLMVGGVPPFILAGSSGDCRIGRQHEGSDMDALELSIFTTESGKPRPGALRVIQEIMRSREGL
jgi:hypothetical protein